MAGDPFKVYGSEFWHLTVVPLRGGQEEAPGCILHTNRTVVRGRRQGAAETRGRGHGPTERTRARLRSSGAARDQGGDRGQGLGLGAPHSEGVRRRSRRGAAKMEGEGKQERSTTQGGPRQMQG